MLRSGLIGLAAALWATTALAQATNAMRELTATFARPGGDELRYALVIGNSAYPDAPLKNPANDARLMSDTLNAVGFAVTEVVDADWRAMKRAIQEFGKQLDLAGDNAVGLFYYAGHGIQVGDSNYLVPVGASIATEADVGIEAVSAQSVLAQMEYARNRLNIVILDACRNNPYRRSFRSAPNGLAQMAAPRGSLLAFATAPGDVAADGTGDNSPYALALAALMKAPGLEVYDLFREVVVQVRETAPRQVPWFQGALDGKFYFSPAEAVATEPTVQEPPVQEPPVQEPPVQEPPVQEPPVQEPPVQEPPVQEPPGPVYDRSADLAFWDSIVDGNDPRLFEAYLKQFPEGVFAALARIRIEALTQQAATPPVAPVEEPPAAPVAEAPPVAETAEEPPAAAPETTVAAIVPEEPTPAEVEAGLDLTPEDRRLIQRALNGLGFDAGTVDGVFGPGTRKAIARRQAAGGVEATGYLTAPQAQSLIALWQDIESKYASIGATPPEGPGATSAVPGRIPSVEGEIGEGWAPVVDVEGVEIYELGLELAALTPDVRASFGLDDSIEGLVITDYRFSGNAAQKKLATGDVIERVNRQRMTKPVEVINEITVRLREGQTALRLDVRKPDGALWTVLVPIN